MASALMVANVRSHAHSGVHGKLGAGARRPLRVTVDAQRRSFIQLPLPRWPRSGDRARKFELELSGLLARFGNDWLSLPHGSERKPGELFICRRLGPGH